MVFTEQKTKIGFLYKVEDVFGEMEFKSPDKLEPKILDQLFLAIFNIKSGTETVEGDVKGTGIHYKFKKAKQWDKLDPEQEARNTYNEIQKTILDNKLEKICEFNLFNTIKQWLSKLKKSLRKFIA